MINELGLTDLIKKYQKSLGVNPASRVFAPLAECYRRAGMHSEALDILKEGIKKNPDYILGYLGLAQCYYDMKQYQAGYTLLRPYIETNKDNLKLQRVFASLCLKLDFHEEALNAYKYILFMNPSDGEAADFIAEYEDVVVERKITQKKLQESFPVSKLHSDKYNPSQEDIDEWVAVDLSGYKKDQGLETPSAKKPEIASIEERDAWTMEKSAILHLDQEQNPDVSEILYTEVDEKENEEVEERKFFVVESQDKDAKASQPLITHTLVDLYCAQGHFEKAYDLLLKILELNPNDEKTKIKLREVEEFLPAEEEILAIEELELEEESLDANSHYSADHEEVENEQQAHERLMRLVESKVQGHSQHNFREDLEERLWLFHDKVKQKAKEKSHSSED